MVRQADLKAQYLGIQEEVDRAIRSVLGDSAFIGGKYVRTFEEEFAAYVGARECVGAANGTDALEIALESLDLPPGSEVIVPANTFIATAEAVTRSGLRVVFADCDPETLTLSVRDAARRITPRTSAIVPVHLYGRACDMTAVLALARQHGLRVVEDCAQAHGARHGDRAVGTFGDLAAFSFFPGKNLGAYGDAGAIATSDPVLAVRCRRIANHGRLAKHDHEIEGRNSRLDGLQAAILSVKLRHLESWTEARIAVAAAYREGLSGVPGLVLPSDDPAGRHVYHLFVVRSAERDLLKEHLKARDIQVGIHYPVALPRLRVYARLGQAEEPMAAARIADEVLSLPIGEHLDAGQLALVVAAVRSFQPTPAVRLHRA